MAIAFALIGAIGARAHAFTTSVGTAAAGSIGLRLVDVPQSERDDPRARLYIVDGLTPGSVIHRRIEISNTTNSLAHVRLYAAAATIADGIFTGSAGHTPNDLSSWTSIAPHDAGVAARGRAIATVTLAVPRDAASGERYGVVWAEVRSTSGGNLVQVSRVGIRLYVSVGSGGAPAANFTIDSLTAARALDGRPVVLAAVRNSGGRALDLSGTLRLTAGPGGLSAGPFGVNLGTTLAVGDTGSVTISLDQRVPAGPWTARITLRSGLVERSASAIITFPTAGTAHAVIVTSTRPPLLFVSIAAFALALMSIVIALLMRNRRRHRHIRGRLAI